MCSIRLCPLPHEQGFYDRQAAREARDLLSAPDLVSRHHHDRSADPIPPSGNVTVDVDGTLHATITSTSDSVHSGFVISAPQERIGLPQAPLGPTRFRITFTAPGVYPYICACMTTWVWREELSSFREESSAGDQPSLAPSISST